MKLLIISATPHYLRDGVIVGHGPTVTEINRLATLFDAVEHIGAFHNEPAPSMSVPYTASHLKFTPLPAVGGRSLRSKLEVARLYPGFARVILRALPTADVVHVRCPANIGMLAIVLLAFVRKPRLRWVKYAGNWKPETPDAWSGRFQRWWLRHNLHRGTVTVNGIWENEPAHVVSFINPSISDQDIATGAVVAHSKTLTSPLRAIFVGAIVPKKGADRALRIVKTVAENGIPITLDIVGEGSALAEAKALATELGIADRVQFHGSLAREDLNALYTDAHLMVFPTARNEGWPKVLSEGMAYGVVPITSSISSIPQYLNRYSVGVALDPFDHDGFVDAIAAYYHDPARWKTESENGLELARQFTFTVYLDDVRRMLKIP